MKISEIAKGMRAEANRNGIARYTLERGLRLTLQKAGRVYILSLTRNAQHASDTEREICRKAFGCPEIPKSDTSRYQIEYVRGYGVTRFVWTEQAGQSELIRVEEEHLYHGYGAGDL